jgi:carboxyl-terminal processing protease
MIPRMKPGTAVILACALVTLVAAFVLVAERAGAADPRSDGVWWDEDVARFVRERLANYYVDKVDDDRASKAFYKAMRAYLREFDEYCDFVPPSEHKRHMDETEGQYAGLGVRIREEEDGLVVIGMLPDGPAAKASIGVGDTIVAADGLSLARESGELDVTRLLKGTAGSAVRLRVVAGPRPEKGPATGAAREIVVTRAIVRSPTVFARRAGTDPQFGVIRISEFANTTADDFDRALQEVLQHGVRGLVIDLRWNRGGVLSSAVHVVDRFLSKGRIVQMQGRAEGANREHWAKPDPKDVPDDIPVAVLVNRDSASASEVVAGALQDHRRALLVGERTYGKFLVQSVVDIQGKDSALTLTTARYYTPSGRSYQRKPGEHSTEGDARAEGDEPAGLLPDDISPLDDKERLKVRQAFVNEEGVRWSQPPQFPDVAADAVDPQLKRAMEILQGQLFLRKIRRTPR